MSIIITSFQSSGTPVTGLTPTIRIRDAVGGALLVVDDSMYEIGDGQYGYDYLAYDVTGSYAIRCDGGGSLSDAERYTFAGNESYVDDIWDQPMNVHSGSNTAGGFLSFVHDIEGGRWLIDENTNEMIFYKSDGVTEVARFDLYDIDGISGHVNPYERRRQ